MTEAQHTISLGSVKIPANQFGMFTDCLLGAATLVYINGYENDRAARLEFTGARYWIQRNAAHILCGNPELQLPDNIDFYGQSVTNEDQLLAVSRSLADSARTLLSEYGTVSEMEAENSHGKIVEYIAELNDEVRASFEVLIHGRAPITCYLGGEKTILEFEPPNRTADAVRWHRLGALAFAHMDIERVGSIRRVREGRLALETKAYSEIRSAVESAVRDVGFRLRAADRLSWGLPPNPNSGLCWAVCPVRKTCAVNMRNRKEAPIDE